MNKQIDNNDRHEVKTKVLLQYTSMLSKPGVFKVRYAKNGEVLHVNILCHFKNVFLVFILSVQQFDRYATNLCTCLTKSIEGIVRIYS